MENYRTEDGLVSKYIHDDGSETAIKTVSSCGNIFNKLTGKIETTEIERNKYSVFVSSSVGCPIGCKFCYLTVKKFPYYQLTPKQIISNVQEVLSKEVEANPSLRKKYLKLSWMGMGDAFLLNPIDLRRTTNKLTDWIIGDKGFAAGLDGVDIATVMPRENPGWPHQLAGLNDDLIKRFKRNPNNEDRSAVRLFYSLHSLERRHELIPCSKKGFVIKDLLFLDKFRKWYGIDVILHHLFLEGINDDLGEEAESIINFLNEKMRRVELRVLRFNECENSPFKESKKFDSLVSLYASKLSKVKYQVSAGSEIKAACGQFLCKPLTITKDVL